MRKIDLEIQRQYMEDALNEATYNFDGLEICGVTCPYCGSIMKLNKKG